jgi:hypothetical protein
MGRFIQTTHPLHSEQGTNLSAGTHFYNFQRNARGDYVAEIDNDDDYRAILSIGQGYQPYVEVGEITEFRRNSGKDGTQGVLAGRVRPAPDIPAVAAKPAVAAVPAKDGKPAVAAVPAVEAKPAEAQKTVIVVNLDGGDAGDRAYAVTAQDDGRFTCQLAKTFRDGKPHIATARAVVGDKSKPIDNSPYTFTWTPETKVEATNAAKKKAAAKK